MRDILEKLIPIAIIGGAFLWILTQIKPGQPGKKIVEIKKIEVR